MEEKGPLNHPDKLGNGKPAQDGQTLELATKPGQGGRHCLGLCFGLELPVTKVTPAVKITYLGNAREYPSQSPQGTPRARQGCFCTPSPCAVNVT